MVSSTSRAEAGTRARRSSPTSRRRCQRSRTARQRMHSSSAGASATRTGRSSRPATSCARSSDPSAGARGPPRISRCLSGPMLASGDRASCDLSRGRPHGRRDRHDRLPPATTRSRLPGSLTGWAPIPPGTPNRDLGTRPVAVDGPVHDRELRAGDGHSRWFAIPTSACGRGSPRPDGFPDKIVVQTVGRRKRRHGRRARAGRRRLCLFTAGGHQGARGLSRHATRRGCTCIQNRRRSSSSSTRHFRPSTTFASGAQSTSPSTAPPLRGPGRAAARQADVPAPPAGHGGFRRYCPYTADPDRTGEWKAPDLTRGAPPCRCLGHAGHEGDGLDGPRLLGAGRGGGGLHLERAGLPRKHQASRESGRLQREEGRREDPGGSGRSGRAGYGLPRQRVLPPRDSVSPGQQNLNPSFFCDRRWTPRSHGRRRSSPPTRTPQSGAVGEIENESST